MLRRVSRVLLVASLAVACAGDRDRPPADVAVTLAVAEGPPPLREHVRPARRGRLSPLADSVSRLLVWVPTTQTWFTAAARNKRLLVDLGRADVNPGKSPALDSAYREAASYASPVPVGTRLRLHGPWGADDAVVTGFEWSNGRIVATLELPPRVDSIVRRVEPLPAAATRADSATAAVRDSCDRKVVPPELALRAGLVRDSLEQWLRDTQWPPHARLGESVRVRSSRLPGCYGIGRVLLVVSLRAGRDEYLREQVVVVGDSGQVIPLRASDYRFRAHDGLTALDADGDGIDDVATRAIAQNAGAITILKLEDGKRLRRLTSGFAWEAH